jgi:outer membrane immunogenic protein
MKKLLITARSVVIAMSMVGIAHADTNNWTGFYAGVDVGLAFNDIQLTSQQLGFTRPSGTCDMSSDFSAFFSGIQLGYMHQFTNSFVSGIEANTTFNSNQKHTSSCNSEFNPDVYDGFTFRNQLQTSIKGRVGRTLNWNKNNFLPYVTAGASLANLGLTYKNEGGDYYSNTTTKLGWLIGAGVEWAFMQHWSLRAEYYFVDYGNAISLNIPTVYGLLDTNGKAHVDLKSNNIAVSINYWI